MCNSCSSSLRQRILEHKCEHKTADVQFMNHCCYKCFRKLEQSHEACTHMNSVNMRQLEASGYGFQLIDNYSKEIVFETSYFQTSPDEETPVKHFLNLLRDEMVPYLTDRIVPNVPMKITETEQEMFEAAQSCYCCHKKFRDMPGQDNKVRDHW